MNRRGHEREFEQIFIVIFNYLFLVITATYTDLSDVSLLTWVSPTKLYTVKIRNQVMIMQRQIA